MTRCEELNAKGNLPLAMEIGGKKKGVIEHERT